MDELEAKIELYKEYSQSVEKFKDNNFKTNRFYIVILAILLVVILLSKQFFTVGSLVFTFTFSLFGFCTSILWLINQDSYNTLIGIKLGKVLEKMETNLPFSPFRDEHEFIIEYKRKQKFTFSNLQNLLAVLMALIFTILFFLEIPPFYIFVKSLMVN